MAVSLRQAVGDAMRHWPNAGGDETPRQNIRTAFGRMRRFVDCGLALDEAAAEIARDAARYADM